MVKQQKKKKLVYALLATLFVNILFGVMTFQAVAQDGNTPTPTPTSSEDRFARVREFYNDPEEITGDAQWELADNTFQSFYPNGFEFTIRASSTGGEIEAATVQWSHAPRNQRRQAAEFNPETGIFTATWEAIENGVPPWVAVNYRWLFTDAAGNTYRSGWFMGEQYVDETTEWERYESEDVIVYVESGLPAETGQQTLDAMAAQRETYRAAWGGLLPYKPRAILFASRESFNAWRNAPDARSAVVAGLTDETWGGTVQSIIRNDVYSLTWGTVLHEVGHLYQGMFSAAGFPAGTWWIEGNASLFELYQDYDIEQRVRNLAINGQLPNLLEGPGPGPFSTGPDGLIRFGYDVGYTFWKWIVENYGLDGHRQIIELVRSGRDRNEVLEEVTGLPYQEIEARWRTWLGASAIPPTLFPTQEFRFPPTSTPPGTPSS